MQRIRLRRSITLTASASGAVLASDLRAVQLEGADVAVFVTRIVPLLDGSRTAADVASALPEYSAQSVHSFLSKLEGLGFLEPAVEDTELSPELSGEAAFFARWGDAERTALKRLRDACVCVVGLEPAGATAVVELAAAGIGSLVLVDDFDLLPADCLSARCWTARDIGQARRKVLQDYVSAHWPAVALNVAKDFADPVAARKPDLYLHAAHADDLRAQRAAAEFAHRQSVPYVSVRVTGLEAVIGPLVIPGETACWNCARLRALGTTSDPQRTGELQRALLEASPPQRESETLAPMAGIAGHLAALETIKFLTRYTPSDLVGRLLIQHLVTLESTRHTVVRLPWCELCGGGAGAAGFAETPATGDRETTRPAGDGAKHALFNANTPEEVRASLPGWVDDRVGVIQRLIVHQPDAGEPEIPFTSSAVVAQAPGEVPITGREIASGKGLTVVDAMIGAVGEAIERYSAARVNSQRLRYSSLQALRRDDEPALDPDLLAGYTPEQYRLEQFPYAPIASEQPIAWVPGQSITTGRRLWVPALTAYLDFHAPSAEYFTQVTSNGLAAGSDFEDAARRATLELIERDAFMLTWLAQRPATNIELGDKVDSRVRQVFRELQLLGAEARAYLLPNEFDVPVVLCIGFGDGERWPGATASLGCDLDPLVALTKSVLEQAHVGPYLRRLYCTDRKPAPAAYDDVRELEDHALFYGPVNRREAFEFLERDGGSVCTDEWTRPTDTSLQACSTRIAAASMDVALIDVTAPDVFSSPFRVVRALGERFQQIDFGYECRRLGHSRLQALATQGVNPWPHPLA